jgi:hypothetical protein
MRRNCRRKLVNNSTAKSLHAGGPENGSPFCFFPRRAHQQGGFYAFKRELEQLRPDNRHIRDKIRQQLQVLRDRGFLIQAGRGVWQLK